MKALKFPLAVLLASTACSMGAVVTFDGYTFEQPLDTVPGWSTSQVNPVATPRAWIEDVGGNMAGAIGGAYIEAANSVFSATYDSSYYGPSIQFSADILLVDSTSLNPGRDTFSIDLETGSGSSLMSIVFLPTTDFGDGISRWEVGYSVGGGEVYYTTSTFREDAFYNVSVKLTGSGYEFTFGNSVDSETFNGSIAGYNSATSGMGDISMVWTKAPTTQFGDNFMVFDNVTVIPEPSAALLSGIATLFLFRRRR